MSKWRQVSSPRKMPTVFGKQEGRGNGSKTVIPNITDLGFSLHRDPGEVNKFFGCELGAQTTYNKETDRAVVNGHHTDKALQQLVHKYIEGFVLCPNCGLPETEYKIKSGIINHKCAAGHKAMVDMTHKLCTYILAADKKEKADAKKAGKKKDKKKVKKGSDSEGDEEKKEKKEKKSKDKKKDKKDKKKDKKSKEAKSQPEDAVSGDEGGDDGGSSPTEHVDDANAMALAVEATTKFLSDNPDASPAAIAEIVVNEQMASGLKSQEKIHIFIRAAFTLDFYKKKQVVAHAPTIAAITQGKTVMERHLISACEGLCVDKPKNFAVLIKQLFDEEVMEEDTILEWAGEGRTDYTLESVDEDQRCNMRAEAEPVVVWLQEDDSDDEEED